MTKTLSPITPGDILLEEFLKPMNITQSQLSKDICVPANRVSQVVHGKYFGIEPEFWLNLQVRYNMKIARKKIGKKIEKEVKVYFHQTEIPNHASV